MTSAVLPTDFTYLLHLAAYQGPETDYDYAITVNAEGAGFLMQHCRKAKAALVMSTSSVYRPDDDPMHAFLETDPIGGGTSPWAPTYAVSKIAQEAVVRQNARSLGLPTVIARMNASYGPNGGLPALNLDALLAGNPIVARADPCPYSPIYQDDINEQVEPLLAAASMPATIVNWGGDEVVTIQEWSAYFGTLIGRPAEVTVTEFPGSHQGMISDPTKRVELTGPCRVGWREGNAGNGRGPHGALGEVEWRGTGVAEPEGTGQGRRTRWSTSQGQPPRGGAAFWPGATRSSPGWSKRPACPPSPGPPRHTSPRSCVR